MSQRITAISCLTVAWLPHSLSPCPSLCYLCCRLPADMRLSLRAECPCCSRHRHTHTHATLSEATIWANKDEPFKMWHIFRRMQSENKQNVWVGVEVGVEDPVWQPSPKVKHRCLGKHGPLQEEPPKQGKLRGKVVDCRMKKLSCILTPTKQKNVCFGMVDANHIVN